MLLETRWQEINLSPSKGQLTQPHLPPCLTEAFLKSRMWALLLNRINDLSLFELSLFQQKSEEGFPAGSVVESACPCSRHGFDSCSGEIPHALEQLNLRIPTTEPAL